MFVVAELGDGDGIGITSGAKDVAICEGIPALVKTATTDELIEAAAAGDSSAAVGNPGSDEGGELERMVLGAAPEEIAVTKV